MSLESDVRVYVGNSEDFVSPSYYYTIHPEEAVMKLGYAPDTEVEIAVKVGRPWWWLFGLIDAYYVDIYVTNRDPNSFLVVRNAYLASSQGWEITSENYEYEANVGALQDARMDAIKWVVQLNELQSLANYPATFINEGYKAAFSHFTTDMGKMYVANAVRNPAIINFLEPNVRPLKFNRDEIMPMILTPAGCRGDHLKATFELKRVGSDADSRPFVTAGALYFWVDPGMDVGARLTEFAGTLAGLISVMVAQEFTNLEESTQFKCPDRIEWGLFTNDPGLECQL
jgi:hypothetical protein